MYGKLAGNQGKSTPMREVRGKPDAMGENQRLSLRVLGKIRGKAATHMTLGGKPDTIHAKLGMGLGGGGGGVVGGGGGGSYTRDVRGY